MPSHFSARVVGAWISHNCLASSCLAIHFSFLKMISGTYSNTHTNTHTHTHTHARTCTTHTHKHTYTQTKHTHTCTQTKHIHCTEINCFQTPHNTHTQHTPPLCSSRRRRGERRGRSAAGKKPRAGEASTHCPVAPIHTPPPHYSSPPPHPPPLPPPPTPFLVGHWGSFEPNKKKKHSHTHTHTHTHTNTNTNTHTHKLTLNMSKKTLMMKVTQSLMKLSA